MTREQRYLDKVDRRGPDDCWLWTASRNTFGYGTFRGDVIGGKQEQLAHRYGYRLLVGPIKNGLHVCHTCDNPPCQNPAHWFLGTPTENHADKVAKGRQRSRGLRGTDNPTAKLTEGNVHEMFRLYAAGVTQQQIAERFDISQGTAGKILRGERWTHLGLSAPHETAPRRVKGERHHQATLTDEQVEEIRTAYRRGGVSQQSLADRYGVSQVTVSRIVRGVVRSHGYER